MGRGDYWAHRRQATRGSGDLRTAGAAAAEVPELCPYRLRVGNDREECPAAVLAAGESGERTTQADLDGRDEPVPGENRLRAGVSADVEASTDSVYDSGGSVSADLHPVYRPGSQAALFVSAVPGEPDSGGFRVCGDADLDQSASAERKVT